MEIVIVTYIREYNSLSSVIFNSIDFWFVVSMHGLFNKCAVRRQFDWHYHNKKLELLC